MKNVLRYSLVLVVATLLMTPIKAQEVRSYTQDDVVQLYGVVMTADSLQAIPMASVIVQGKGRGTLTNNQGVFSIVVLKGDTVRFSCVGFKDHVSVIPKSLEGSQYSLIQLLINDTAYLPATILKPRPTREQFERDFANTHIPDDEYEIARRNTSEAQRRALINALPADGREAVNMQMRQNATKYYYQGQQAPINLFNPAAWTDFIQAWKRGDFKNKN